MTVVRTGTSHLKTIRLVVEQTHTFEVICGLGQGKNDVWIG